MKTMYMLFSFCVFALFCLLEARGVAWDLNWRKATSSSTETASCFC